jgi:hypothetical protein
MLPAVTTDYVSSMRVLVASSDSDGLLALPVHPIFVHFPIALLTLVWVLVALRHWRRWDHLETFIQPALALGVGIIPVLVVKGYATPGG